MRVLLDTNIALRLVNASDPDHPEMTVAVRNLYRGGHELFIVPQCIYEMWAVMTRPAGATNGFGLLPADVALEIDRFLARIPLLPDSPNIFPRWLTLVTQHQVSGKPTHDARLAAALQVHGLDAILTGNVADFKRSGIQVINPADLSEGGPTL
ncbi:PIN domain-containing protein [Deinococcus saxicola]|uniref:type II toxin-antitoxin system VapC family toxin n=1 Tax=Deinococcus saxicola TaxID=249406 RepID=UPI0039F0323E